MTRAEALKTARAIAGIVGVILLGVALCVLAGGLLAAAVLALRGWP